MDHQHEDEEDYRRLSLLLSPQPVPQPLENLPAPVVGPRPILKRRGKKRSSRACTTCRARKVRCNIVAHGAPCSNCRHDEVECILPLSRRRRAAREREENTRMAANGTTTSLSRAITLERDSSEQHPGSRTMSTRGAQIGNCYLPTCEDAQDTQRYIRAPHGMRISEHVLSEVIPTRTISPCQQTTPARFASRKKSWSQILPPLASAPLFTRPDSLNLSSTFTPFPSHLDPSDLSYLKMRDALTIPSEEMQIQLLRAYVDFVHGSMPLLNLDEFLTAVKWGHDESNGKSRDLVGDPSERISFLLFQAVMFAASGFVSMRVLREEGYMTRECAQRAFFNRVRLLYDFDTCIDRLPIIQSLLLMTHYQIPNPSPATSQKDAYHYLGLAISLSYSLGLHRSMSNSTNYATLIKHKLERRIWWICFILDRSLALGTNGEWTRLIRIRREDCDVEMLSLEDFDLYDGVEEGEGVEDRRASLNARTFVEKAKLSWCSSDVLISQYGSPTPIVQSSPPSSIVPPHQTFSNVAAHSEQHFEEEIHFHSTSGSGSGSASTLTEDECSYSENHESTLSPSEDCITPRYKREVEVSGGYEGSDFTGKIQEKVQLVYSEEDLENGYGVDEEYDDYMEYLKVGDLLPESVERIEREKEKEKEKERASWAGLLDCDNDEMIVV